MKKRIVAAVLSCVIAAPAMAQQLAPPPNPAPRLPVHREPLAEQHHSSLQRDIDGPALILDGEKLRVDNADLRLFGIVPPQLSASFGPQARAALDSLLGGGQNVECHIRDRDHDGRLLATCHSANGTDPALDLLRRGLAVATRGTLADTELAEPYIAAEQAAQAAKLGLWSTTVAAPAESSPAPAVNPAKADTAAKASEAKTAPVISIVAKPPVSIVKDVPVAAVENPSFFARYQVLIAGSLMLLTALSIVGALAYRHYTEKRDEMKALAAALRGELLAARAVCLTRIKSIASPDDDVNSAWPRIRSTLYQAYVGRLGWLGAELARQIASIYGQASDYASYYNNTMNDGSASLATPKRQALQALASHIDEVLPRLATIEKTGQRLPNKARPLRTTAIAMPSPMAARVAMPKPVTTMIAHQEPQPAPAAIAPAFAETAMVVASTVTHATQENKLLSIVRNWRERFVEPQHDQYVMDDQIVDYAAIIEEEAERFSFGGEFSDAESLLGKTGRL